ncbi:VOC family protein [Thalassomonas sp. RHCl1]|uniref:VOC family protein n=1 Tax=Thalassomonas sp. RHCl1 TaxID=2995320 RepID=UPI00248B8034|nr:VOC family protein [Thalassomonas sp. RHCl1]
MPAADKINYVEFPSRDLAATKAFFETVFGWAFQDFGPDYSAFTNEGLDGGFFKSELISSSGQGAPLVVLFSNDLEASLLKVAAGGGTISKEIFSFPGGRRFHFTEPGGNELAVWSDGE